METVANKLDEIKETPLPFFTSTTPRFQAIPSFTSSLG